jgi:hypothetical protein
MDERVLEDLDIVEKVLLESDYSIVVVKNGVILDRKRGGGLKPLLNIIDELKEALNGSVVGDKILGKASALLCVYAKVGGVFTPQATKTAIAVLIRAGIPGQTDKMVPYIKNKNGDDMCPFEKMLKDIDTPEEAYKILKDNIK